MYKCVCQQYAEKMYNNLIEIVSDYLKRVSEELKVTCKCQAEIRTLELEILL